MKKRWVIPDLHGCSRTLKAIVEEQIRPEKSDELYFLGDYIDRGWDSKGVIDYIIDLKKQRFNVRTMMGNHEEFLLDLYDMETKPKKFDLFDPTKKKRKIWYGIGGRNTLRSFGIKFASEIPEKYIQWMRELEYYIELDGYVLVHAGMNFDCDDPFEDKKSMLWIREYSVQPEKIGNRRLVHGHVPVNLELIDLSVNNSYYNFIDIDNGPYIRDREGFGNLVALELNELKYCVQYSIDPE